MEFLAPPSSILIRKKKKIFLPAKKSLHRLPTDFILRAIQLASRLPCLT